VSNLEVKPSVLSIYKGKFQTLDKMIDIKAFCNQKVSFLHAPLYLLFLGYPIEILSADSQNFQ
jgi:hypothetical protein